MEKLKVTEACIGCGLCVAENEKYFDTKKILQLIHSIWNVHFLNNI